MISWGVGIRKSCIQTSMQFVSHPRPHSFQACPLSSPIYPYLSAQQTLSHIRIQAWAHTEASQQCCLSGGYEKCSVESAPHPSPFHLQEIKNIEPEEIKFSKFQSKSYVGKVFYISVLCHPPPQLFGKGKKKCVCIWNTLCYWGPNNTSLSISNTKLLFPIFQSWSRYVLMKLLTVFRNCPYSLFSWFKCSINIPSHYISVSDWWRTSEV